MRKLSKKETAFLKKNPIVVGTELRRKAGREGDKEWLDSEKKATKPFTAKYVREVVQTTMGDFIIDEKATKEYLSKSEESKENSEKEEESKENSEKEEESNKNEKK